MTLQQLIAQELKDKDFAQVNIERLYEFGKGTRYSRCTRADFHPNFGVVGDWSKEEKDVVKSIFLSPYLVNNYHSREIAENYALYKHIERMKPGDMARIKTNEQEYCFVVCPPKESKDCLVLFVK